MDEPAAVVNPMVGARAPDVTLSFEDFFEAEGPRLYRAARLLTRSHHEAEELCQDAFFKVWQRWDRVGSMENPSGYLYRTALNEYRKWHRRALLRARQVVRLAPADDPQLTVQARDTFVRWLAGLTPRQRSAVVLTALLDLPVEETAAAMRVKPGTVHGLLSQSRTALKKATEPDHE